MLCYVVMGPLKCLNPSFLQRLVRRNNQLSLCCLLALYFVFSKLMRYILIEETDLPRDLSDLRTITLKPGLLEIINATAPFYPSTERATYLLENTKLCSSSKSVNVVIMVYTAPTYFERRKVMRDTWLNQTLLSRLGPARVVFLLGKVNTTSLQSVIEEEFQQYGDILQGDFMDTYANLTYKGLMGLQWLSENCKKADILIKVDDDIVINTYRFFTDIVPDLMAQREQVFCWRSPRSIIYRGVRHKSYMPRNFFHGMHSYPLYCKGPFVFMTFDLVPLILKSATMTPFLWLEDLYLYGVVMQNIPEIKYRQFRKGTDFDLDIRNVMRCFNDTVATCEMFVAGVSEAGDMLPVWTAMLKQNEQTLRGAALS